jgi:membrane protein
MAWKGISRTGVHDTSWGQFARDLRYEIQNDRVPSGAAALAYYLTLAIFPAILTLLTVLPYLPIDNVDRAIMDLLSQALPGDTSSMLSRTLEEILSNRQGGLLSIGLLATLWAASTGVDAIMEQLNVNYDVDETRSFFRRRTTALLLTLFLGLVIVATFTLIVAGGVLQEWLATRLGWGGILTTAFAVGRWIFVLVGISLALAVLYRLGPNTKQRFQFITPGSVAGTLLFVAATLGLKLYVDQFGNYNATYGSIGAVIVLMLWLYLTGLIVQLGAEINVLIEEKSPGARERKRPRLVA